MIRTILKPDSQNISIILPQNFVGKQIEIIAFTIDEALNKPMTDDKTQTHLVSQAVLAKDWLTFEEDNAWKDL